MVLTYKKVKKRAINSIIAQLNKLIRKYGVKEVWLVTKHHFDEIAKENKLKKTIKEKENELAELKGSGN